MTSPSLHRTPAAGSSSPWATLSREDWSARRAEMPLPLTSDELDRLRGIGEDIDLDEVADAYLPLSRLLNLYVTAVADLHTATGAFLGELPAKTPFVIGIAGSVAVGKSTTARILQTLLARWPDHPHVELVTTDGFLHSNRELAERGLLERKGFPESYDAARLVRFVADVKSGMAEVAAPVYSHLTYDIVEGETVVVRQPDILIVEGLNVLQTGPAGPADTGPRSQPRSTPRVFVSDFFDFSVYVDADEVDVRRWYRERFRTLRRTAFADERSYFHRYADLGDDEADTVADDIWTRINGRNLRENILPTRSRADLVLHKASDHHVARVHLRKL